MLGWIKCGASWLLQFTNTYSSCIEMPCLKLYHALADTSNAFQQAPPPQVARYIRIDEPFRDWYKERFNKNVDPMTHVVPIYKNLQGLPLASNSWESHIYSHLLDTLKFRNTTHDRNLDDYSIASQSEENAVNLIAIIDSFASTASKGIGTFVGGKGIHNIFNGVDIYQTRDFLRTSLYLRKRSIRPPPLLFSLSLSISNNLFSIEQSSLMKLIVF